jgi:toxin YxiD
LTNKVDIAEVIDFKNDFKTTSSHIKASIENVIQNIQQIDEMESFSGKAAKNAKNYFWNFHKESLLLAFEELYNDLLNNLNDHIDTFNSNVDSSETAIVQSNYLDDLDNQIDLDYRKLDSIHTTVQRTIDGVSDITSAKSPNFYSIRVDKEEVLNKLNELEKNLSSFTKEGKYNKSQIEKLLNYIERTIKSVNGNNQQDRFENYKSEKNFNNLKDFVTLYLEPGYSSTTTSVALANAAKNQGISVSTYEKNGKTTYRLNASEEALKKLGINIDTNTRYSLQQSGKTGQAKAPLNYYDKNSKKQIWSDVGKETIKKYPTMAVKNYNGSSIKNVGRTVLGGATSFVNDLNPKEFLNSSLTTKFGKSLGIGSIGLSYYSNHTAAKEDGLEGIEAVGRATVDTAIDTTVGGAVITGGAAVGTALIPIPVVGTAIGFGAGIVVNAALNTKFGSSNKSVMDRAKDAVHKVADWFF